MRELTISLAALLLAAALVYAGLNLAELGITGLLSCECNHEAFSIRMGPQEALVITFAGRSTCLHTGELCAALRQWWDRLLRPSGAT